jgi:hypothetical protein
MKNTLQERKENKRTNSSKSDWQKNKNQPRKGKEKVFAF